MRTYTIEKLPSEPWEEVKYHDWRRLTLYENGQRMSTLTLRDEVARDYADYWVEKACTGGLIAFALKRGSLWAKQYATA